MSLDHQAKNKSLHDLINLYLMGDLSRERFRSLEKLLLENRACREEFRRMVYMDTSLRELAVKVEVAVGDEPL